MAELALVVDDIAQRRRLEAELVKADHYVLFSCDQAGLAQCHAQAEADPTLWLLLLPAATVEDALNYVERHSATPALILDDIPADAAQFQRWSKRTFAKLGRELGEQVDEDNGELARDVWLLGASLGGPDAVQRFLMALPAELPISMVYVQHIDECFDQLLVSNLSRRSHYRVELCDGEKRLLGGQLLVVPPDKKPRFLPFGRVIDSGKAWRGPYRPGLDEVAEDLVRMYRERLGLIVFSGTCNDGEAAALQVADAGGMVWVQSPESCVASTMPDAVLATGTADRVGDPETLAAALAAHYNCATAKMDG